MAGELRRPNGIVLSRDEKLLYVADSDAESFYVFDVQPGGTAADRREFAHLAEITRTDKGMNIGVAGIAIVRDDGLYCISHAGIEVFSPKGEPVGIIPVPVKAHNLAFARKERKTLDVVGHGYVYKLRMLAQRFERRSK